MGWMSSRLLYCFWFAFVLPPPRVSSFSAVYEDQNAQGRKFGGYRIAPKTCKDLTSSGKGVGLCMFNYDCTKKNGTVVGSCMDGFLFGACCRLPPGANIVSMEIPSAGVTQRTRTTLAEVISSSTGSSTVHGPAETVLFHENGTVANEIVRPEDFEFNSNPEYYVATEATPPPPSRHSTNPQKSTVWKSTTESWLTTKVRPSWTSLSEESFVQIPTLSVGGSPDEPQDSDSINHILSILEDSNPNNSPQKESAIYSSAATPSSLSTWVSIDSKAPTSYHSTTPVYPSTYLSTNPQQTFIYSSPSTQSFVSSYYTQPAQSSVKPYFTSPKPTTLKASPYPSHKPQYSTYKPVQLYESTPRPVVTYQSTSSPEQSYYTIESQQVYYNTEQPQTSYYTTHKPSSHYSPKPSSSKKPTTTVLYSTLSDKKPLYSTSLTRKPTTTTQYVQGPGFQVSITPKPVQATPEPVPTVIVLGPIHPTKKPAPVGTIITVNPDGDVVTYKPAAAATAKPIYHGANHGPLFTTLKPEVTTHGTTGSHHKPATSYHPATYSTPTQVIKDNIPNKTELFAFPPVRDPNVNLTQTYPPEVVHWNNPSTNVYQDEDETTPPLVEDELLDNKVHKFVEKIVQSLQGNFEDLENVLIEGESTNNVTISSYAPPVKRPSSTTKKPTRKPTKKPTTYYSSTSIKPPRPTVPLITRPPTRPSSTKRPTKRPSPTTTVFLEETELYHTSENTPTYSTTELDYKRECGVRPLMKNGRIVGGKGATFGEWPWQVLVREATWLGLFTKNKCGGVLITNKYVITAAHCQPGFLASLIAVFGEYDISGELESKRSSTRNVRRVIVHRLYDAATFENDIALLELDSPIQYDQHIVPICMPDDDEDFTGKVATVTGWGRLRYGGGVPSVLQEVQVPVMENNVCQEMFHTAGHSKTILQSFICAGYANGQRDSCEGDSGGPLMIERPNGRWTLAGTVSHGIKCAAPYLPGVYMRTTYYKPWLETITGVRNS